MRVTSLAKAQKQLPKLVKQARRETIGLTDKTGRLVGLLAGLGEDDLDDFLARTPAFQAMIARSRASLRKGAPVPAEELLREAVGHAAAPK